MENKTRERATLGEPLKYFNDCMKLETDDCIIWKYGGQGMYGTIWLNSKNNSVHRLALQARGIKPSSDVATDALHKPIICHNPKCFNYRHLYWGTSKDNSRDQELDGTIPRGSVNVRSKLTEEQVINILKDDRKQAIIALDYGVSKSLIFDIKNGKCWAHLTNSRNRGHNV